MERLDDIFAIVPRLTFALATLVRPHPKTTSLIETTLTTLMAA